MGQMQGRKLLQATVHKMVVTSLGEKEGGVLKEEALELPHLSQTVFIERSIDI